MSWQKSMSFWECSNLEAEKTSNFAIKEIKGRTIISDKQNLEHKASQVGFMHLEIKIKEKFKLKTKVTKTKI